MENETINNVTEEVVNNAVENAVAADPTFAQKHPVLYATGAGACIMTGIIAAAHVTEAVFELGGKAFNKIRDKRNAKKAAKAKAVEGTDHTVEDA